MSTLGDKLRNGFKKVGSKAKKAIFTGAAVAMFAFPSLVSGQEQTQNYKDFLNPYHKDSLYSKTNQLGYYGSGDATNDGKITWADAEAIEAGANNIRCDVNGDQIFGDSRDLQIVRKMANGIMYSPMDMKHAETVEKREAILEAYIRDSRTWHYNATKANWDCDPYAWNSFFETTSLSKSEASPWYNDALLSEQNMGEINERWGQIKSYIAYIKRKDGGNHTGLAFFVGSDDTREDTPLSSEGNALYVWRILNTSAGDWLEPGHALMDENGGVRLYGYILSKDIDTEEEFYGQEPLLEMKVINGKGTVINPVNGIVTERPKDGGTAVWDIPLEQNVMRKIYPNPITEGNDLTIPYRTNRLGEAQVEIYSMDGKNVYSETYYVNPGENELVVPQDLISKLAKGFYSFAIRSHEGVKSGKFIKQSP